MINDFRRAVYQACATTGLPVYDYWVIDGKFPYIIISEVGAEEFNYKNDVGRQEYTFTIDIFDKNKGKTNAVNYAEEIKAILLALDGIDVRISARHLSDMEPNVMHTVLTLRFFTIK